MADAADSKSAVRKGVWVQVPPRAPSEQIRRVRGVGGGENGRAGCRTDRCRGYEGPAGYSGHADWMNGWDPAVFQRVVDNCYRGGFDCQMNLLGDGQELY
jgi:hypothetical protein